MISPIIKEKITAEIEELKTELEAAAIQLEESASFGDFRENENFHIAKAKYVQIQSELQLKEQQLEEPVEVPVGNTIVVGKLLSITFLGMQNDRGEMVEEAHEEMLLLYAEDGDPVVQGVLSVNCELGRMIGNGREGLYYLSAGNLSRVYDVKIYNGDTAEYFKKYPASRKKKIASLLDGEL